MKNKNLFRLTTTGLMIALVFTASYIRISLPLAGGSTGIHLGNIFCILSGLLLGPIYGGLAAGLGSCLFDITNPLYVTAAPFTLAFKFLMAFVCGLIAYSKSKEGLNVKLNFLAAITGSVTYIVLYLSRTFIVNQFFIGMEIQTNLINVVQKGGISLFNAVIAVVIAVPLARVLRTVLDKVKSSL